MSSFVQALIPIMATIACGFVIRSIGFLKGEAWVGIERVTYYLLFPALLVSSLGRQRLSGVPWPSILLAAGVTVTAAALILLLYRMIFRKENGPLFTSIFQGGVRFNTYITMAMAQAFFGAAGLATASIVAGFMIVIINLFCVSVLVHWGSSSRQGGRAIVKELVINPLILACIIGWSFSLSGFGLPSLLQDFLTLLGRAALPLGLLAVGAALRPPSLAGHLLPVLISSLLQFGVKPLTVSAMVSYTGLGGVTAGVMLMAFMTPTSPASYILARQLGGDSETMASIITAQTLLAFLLMPLLWQWLGTA